VALEDSVSLTKGASNALGATLDLINSAGGYVALDLSTYSHGANAPSARIKATNDNYSAAVTIETKAPGAIANALAQRVRITNSGSVIIGTATSTSDLLRVEGSVSASGAVTLDAGSLAMANMLRVTSAVSLSRPTAGIGMEFFVGNFGAGTKGYFQVYDPGGNAYAPMFLGSSQLIIDVGASGAVGINIDPPTAGYKLDVNGSLRAAGALLVTGAATIGSQVLTGTATGLGIGTATPAGRLHVVGSTGKALFYDADIGVTTVTVLAAGSVSHLLTIVACIKEGTGGTTGDVRSLYPGTSSAYGSVTVAVSAGGTVTVQNSTGTARVVLWLLYR
jgi:hypothetical protein